MYFFERRVIVKKFIFLLCFGLCFLFVTSEALAQNYLGAQSISEGETKQLALEQSTDVEWFKVEVEKDHALKIDFTNVPYDLSYSIHIYDGAMLEKTGKVTNDARMYYDTYLKNNQYFTHKVLKTGTYYIRVGTSGSTYSTESLNIKFHTNEPDANEQNDFFYQATELKDTQSLTLNAPNDEDWFKVEVEKDQGLKLDFTNVPSDLSYSVYIYDGAMLEKTGSVTNDARLYYDNYFKNNQYLTHKVLKTGTYYIRVGTSGSTYSTEPFNIGFRTNEPDANEQNDSFHQATELQDTQSLTLNAPNDEDWFKVEVEQDQGLKLDFTNVPSDLSYSVHIYDGAMLEKTGSVTNDARLYYDTYFRNNQYFTHKVLKTGTYYIRVGTSGSTYTTESFNIKFHTNEPDGNEQNDFYYQAID